MRRNFLTVILSCICLLSMAESPVSKKQIYRTMQKVADWQLSHFEGQVKAGSEYKNSHALWSWTNGAMYLGMLDWARLSKERRILIF